jgi:hypothetical protein
MTVRRYSPHLISVQGREMSYIRADLYKDHVLIWKYDPKWDTSYYDKRFPHRVSTVQEEEGTR